MQEGAWEFAPQVHMCFGGICVPRGITGGCLVFVSTRPVPDACWNLAGLPFMDRIPKCSQKESGLVTRRSLLSHLFADVLLASPNQDFQRVLGRFTAECGAAGIENQHFHV